MNKKILIIQTAFIGDVILATSLIEKLKELRPQLQIDFLLRSGNETLLETSPHIRKIWILNKNKNKFLNLIKLIFQIRKEKYDYVINIQRFLNSGLVTSFSGAKCKVGFSSNPLSLFFSHKVEHKIPHGTQEDFFHEVQRNFQLAQKCFTDLQMPKAKDLAPKLYFTEQDYSKIKKLASQDKYFVIAPASVWYTKQWHISKWTELTQKLTSIAPVYIIGAPSDQKFVLPLTNIPETINVCGKLSLRESALLMQNAHRVFVNDSAPLHLASSVNAKTTAIFCSTVPEFGYSPLSANSTIIQRNPRLECMPCGLHGHKSCPQGHFKCALDIETTKVLKTVESFEK